MEYLISALNVGIETIAMGLLFEGILSTKSKRISFVCLATYAVLSTLSLNFFIPRTMPLVKYFVLFAISYFVASIGYAGTILQKSFSVIVSMVLINAIDLVGAFLVLLYYRSNYSDFLENRALYVFVAFVSKTVLFTVCYAIKRALKHKRVPNRLSWVKWLQILVLPAISIINLQIAADGAFQSGNASAWFVIDAICLLIVNISIVLLLDKIEESHKVMRDNEILQQKMQADMETAKLLMHSYENQRRLTHDFNHHLDVISKLAVSENATKITTYIQSFFQTTSKEIFIVSTNNPILDALLNDKYLQAKEKGVLMQFQINDLSALPMKEEDIVTVLANLLDNAITASAKSTQERIVEVKFLKEEQQILLSVRNTSLPVIITNNNFAHQRSLEHGYGTQNIKACLKKYSFDYALDYKNGWVHFVAFLH